MEGFSFDGLTGCDTDENDDYTTDDDFNILKPKTGYTIKITGQESWHKHEGINKQIIDFHNSHAKHPKKETLKAQRQNNQILNKLKSALKAKQWCKKCEYTGSSFEGLKTTEDGLEFDIMFIIDGSGLEIKRFTDNVAFVLLAVKEDKSKINKQCIQDGYFSPAKVIDKFFGTVQKCINCSDGDVIIRRHGPAVQMDVMTGKNIWYSVDLVPSVEVSKELYVPKPIKTNSSCPLSSEISRLANYTWRRSFSREEKQELKGSDKNNTCKKQVLRILKTIFKRDPTLKVITSYCLKTTLFRAVKEFPHWSWELKCMGERVFDMLGVIEYFLTKDILPHYYLPAINLFENLKSCEQKENLRNRIRGLRRSKVKFHKAIR